MNLGIGICVLCFGYFIILSDTVLQLAQLLKFVMIDYICHNRKGRGFKWVLVSSIGNVSFVERTRDLRWNLVGTKEGGGLSGCQFAQIGNISCDRTRDLEWNPAYIRVGALKGKEEAKWALVD